MANTCSKCGKCIKENASDCVQEIVSSANGDMDKGQSDGKPGLKHGE